MDDRVEVAIRDTERLLEEARRALDEAGFVELARELLATHRRVSWTLHRVAIDVPREQPNTQERAALRALCRLYLFLDSE